MKASGLVVYCNEGRSPWSIRSSFDFKTCFLVFLWVPWERERVLLKTWLLNRCPLNILVPFQLLQCKTEPHKLWLKMIDFSALHTAIFKVMWVIKTVDIPASPVIHLWPCSAPHRKLCPKRWGYMGVPSIWGNVNAMILSQLRVFIATAILPKPMAPLATLTHRCNHQISWFVTLGFITLP